MEQYRGKAIYINIFTQWCPYCIQEMPDIKKAFETYSSDELQMIMVHPWHNETDKETAEIIETYGLESMTFFEDEDMSLVSYLRPPAYPTSVFIKSDGDILGWYPASMNFEMLSYVFDGLGVSKVEDAE